MQSVPLSQHPGCNAACGACHYKADSYEQQLQKKQEWAGLQLHPWMAQLQAMIPAPVAERMGYRAKSWLRTNQLRPSGSDALRADQSVELSFGMLRSIQVDRRWVPEFVSWDTCPIHIPAIQKMIQNFKKYFVGSHLEWVQGLVGVWVGTPHVVFVSHQEHLPLFKALSIESWKQILEPPFQSAWFHQNSQVGLAGRRVFGHRPIIQLYGPASAGLHPIRAFRQNAQSLLKQARARGVEFLLAAQSDFILDLYCGTGDLSLLIPESMGWIGIDASKQAIEFANTLRPPQSSQHVAYTGFVEHRLEDPHVVQQIMGNAQSKYVLWINPPRSGLSADARQAIYTLVQRKRPDRIAYLSCSASSLARDLVLFEELGYSVQDLQPYDFFPQTEHFETLALLSSLQECTL